MWKGEEKKEEGSGVGGTGGGSLDKKNIFNLLHTRSCSTFCSKRERILSTCLWRPSWSSKTKRVPVGSAPCGLSSIFTLSHGIRGHTPECHVKTDNRRDQGLCQIRKGRCQHRGALHINHAIAIAAATSMTPKANISERRC